MGKALNSLIRINNMKRQMAEQKLLDLKYKKSQVEKNIVDIEAKVIEAKHAVYQSIPNENHHIDVLNFQSWESIQAKRINIFKLAITDLDKQQDVFKKEMCQLVVQQQTFEKALLKEKQILALAQDKARDESNNAIWLQRNLAAFK